MNSSDLDSTAAPEPPLSGLAPVFDSLAKQAGPLLGLGAQPATLVGASLALAVAGNAIRVDLPLRPHSRTNSHTIFAGEGRSAAIKLLRILMLPLESHVTEVLDVVTLYTGNRRSMQRELTRSREGLVKLEQRSAVLRETFKQGDSEKAEKELAELAASLGLRYAAPTALRRHVAALRLFLGQMLVVSPMELADLDEWENTSLDGHVTELLVDPGEVDRMLGLNPRHLARLARFRLDSCLHRGIEAHRGLVANHPRPSTLWFANSSEVASLFRNPRLRQHRLADPFVVVRLQATPGVECDDAQFFGLWRGFILSLFHLRLHERQVRTTFAPDAWSFIDSWLHENLAGAEWFAEKVALPSLAMVAAINACGRQDDIEIQTNAVVELGDAQVASALLGPELAATVQRHEASRAPSARPPIERNLESVLAKLSIKGPLTRRELLRSFNQMTVEELGPLLQKGIEAGLVREQSGTYAAAESCNAS